MVSAFTHRCSYSAVRWRDRGEIVARARCLWSARARVESSRRRRVGRRYVHTTERESVCRLFRVVWIVVVSRSHVTFRTWSLYAHVESRCCSFCKLDGGAFDLSKADVRDAIISRGAVLHSQHSSKVQPLLRYASVVYVYVYLLLLRASMLSRARLGVASLIRPIAYESKVKRANQV